MIYRFIDNEGTFALSDTRAAQDLYLPLTNRDGTFLSSISPVLAGDIKRDNDTFLTPPATIGDLKNNLMCRREFFLNIDGKIFRLSAYPNDAFCAGMLYQKITKRIRTLSVDIINFVPFDWAAEIMWIRIENRSQKPVTVTPTSFLPLYGRGEKNLRDHRHVTSLLNRIELRRYGTVLKPTMVFDEQGHHANRTRYFVLGYQDKRIPPQGQFPTLSVFCGTKGNIFKPEAVYTTIKPHRKPLAGFNGKEACAALRFSPKRLARGQTVDYILIMGIGETTKSIDQTFTRFNSISKVQTSLASTKKFWRDHVASLEFNCGDRNLDNWLRWVKLQPILRKLFGCSFLPHFDYGKGGRGWRDLWQDTLTLLLLEPQRATKAIIHNLRGVRVDGSNATIVSKDGQFISDRNKISRVWMDHGVWPFLTIKLCLEKTQDVDILFKKIPYFRDHQIMRAHDTDPQAQANSGYLRTKEKRIYKGTVLEHLLVQHLVQFFNVGRHNNVKLENADWNDGLDMAAEEGESIAFSCMYAYNLMHLARILETLKRKRTSIEVFGELAILFDTIKDSCNYVDYRQKQKRLKEYLEKTKYAISGKTVRLKTESVIADLNKKAYHILENVHTREYLAGGFFNGYYDNHSRRVEGRKGTDVRLMLTSQVFAIMSGAASDKQVARVWQNVKKYLYDKKRGGFRLNTDFKKIYPLLGRAFGFAYGEKENGAFFNHMIVMFAFALYERNFIKEGYFVLRSLAAMSMSPYARIYPQLPEYFDSSGRGKYSYLTGSASWFIFTLLHQVFGVKEKGNYLIIEPKLTKSDFRKNTISINIRLMNQQRITIAYTNRHKKYPVARLKAAYLGKDPLPCSADKVTIPLRLLKKKQPPPLVKLIFS